MGKTLFVLLTLALVAGCTTSSEPCPECPTCTPPCFPDCTRKVCGGDGCGGTCGECSDVELCGADGKCVPEMGCVVLMEKLGDCHTGMPEENNPLVRAGICLNKFETGVSTRAAYYAGASLACILIDAVGPGGDKISQETINVCNALIAECR